MKTTTFQRYKNQNLICHMCVSLEPTTAANNSVRPLNSGTILMIFNVVVIMQSWKYPVFMIKSNQKIMASIGMYILKALPQNTSVHHTIPVYCRNQIMCHVRQCFVIFCLMKANRMPKPHLKELNDLLNCCKTEQYCLLTLLLYGKY